jgi:hypothetical protein
MFYKSASNKNRARLETTLGIILYGSASYMVGASYMPISMVGCIVTACNNGAKREI